MFQAIRSFFEALTRLTATANALAQTGEEVNAEVRSRLGIDPPLQLEVGKVENGKRAKVAR